MIWCVIYKEVGEDAEAIRGAEKTYALMCLVAFLQFLKWLFACMDDFIKPRAQFFSFRLRNNQIISKTLTEISIATVISVSTNNPFYFTRLI